MDFQITFKPIIGDGKVYYINGNFALLNKAISSLDLVSILSTASRIKIDLCSNAKPNLFYNTSKPKLLNDYVLMNMSKEIYIDFAKTPNFNPLVLLCFGDNQVCPEPYSGLFEDYVGDWYNDTIYIIPKTDLKLFKYCKEVYIKFRV